MYPFAGNVIVSMLIIGYVSLLLSVKDAICKVGQAKNVPINKKVL